MLNNRLTSGFSLLELLVVLAILGLAAGFAASRFINRESVQAKVQARRVVAALRYARRIAIIEGVPKEFSLEDIRVSSSSSDSEPTMIWMNKGSDLTSGGEDQPGEIVRKKTIRFYPDGSSTGGELQVGKQKKKIVITVDPFDGKVSVHG